MWIVPWNLFLMKKLLKIEIYGSREQCMGPTNVLKNQILRLLFINSAWTIVVTVLFTPETRAKKKNSKTCKCTNVTQKRVSKRILSTPLHHAEITSAFAFAFSFFFFFFFNQARFLWLKLIFQWVMCTVHETHLFQQNFHYKWISRHYSHIWKLFCYSVFSFQQNRQYSNWP